MTRLEIYQQFDNQKPYFIINYKMLHNNIDFTVKGNQGIVKTYIQYILIFSFHDAHSGMLPYTVYTVRYKGS